MGLSFLWSHSNGGLLVDNLVTKNGEPRRRNEDAFGHVVAGLCNVLR